METETPTFPPLLSSHPVAAGLDPMAKALAAAAGGVDAGAVFWSEREDALEAAILFAPETDLETSMAVILVAQNGLSDALGALSPPEVAVTWGWPNRLSVNGAFCGGMSAEADRREPSAQPSWLAIGLFVQLAPTPQPQDWEPGRDPETTALWEEGGLAINRTLLLESWTRHLLVWLNRWEEDGLRPVHDSWIGRAENVGEAVSLDLAAPGDAPPREGLFLGLDDRGALLLKTETATETVSLTAMLGRPNPWPPAPRSS